MHLSKIAAFVAILVALAGCGTTDSAQGNATRGGGGGSVRMGLPF